MERFILISRRRWSSYNFIKYNKNNEIMKKNQKVKALPSDFLDITAAKARPIDYFVQIHMFRKYYQPKIVPYSLPRPSLNKTS